MKNQELERHGNLNNGVRVCSLLCSGSEQDNVRVLVYIVITIHTIQVKT